MSDQDEPPREPTKLVEWSQTVLGFVLKGFVLLTLLLGFLGLKEGSLDRVLRNSAAPSIAVGVLLTLGVVGGTIIAQSSQGRTRAVGTGVAAGVVAIALATALVLGVTSKDTTDRPVLTTSLEEVNGQLAVKFSASASGLRHEEFLSIQLEGLSSSMPVYQQVAGRFGSREEHIENPATKQDPSDPTEEFVTRLTYRFVGGDVDGNAAAEGSYVLPWGVYERVRTTAAVIASSDPDLPDVKRCDRQAEHRSCVAISLPPPPARPSLTPTISGGRIVSVSAAAEGLRSTQYIRVLVAKSDGRGPATLVSSIQTSPGADGKAATTAPVPSGNVCVVASIGESLFPQPHVAGTAATPSTSGAPPATANGDAGANGAPDDPCQSGSKSVSLRLR